MSLIHNTQKMLEESDTGQEYDRKARIEYHLLSWRELFNKSLVTADRYHTEAGKYILGTPSSSYSFYRLFIVSYPYYKLPQELCLQFDCFEETVEAQRQDGSRLISTGPPAERVAHEFAAFLSLFARKPVIPIGLRRWGDLPCNTKPFYFTLEKYDIEIEQELPSAGIFPDEFTTLVRGLVYMDPSASQAIMNAIKLHHAAVSVVYFDPSIAYLMLVSAVESLAGNEYKEFKIGFDEIEKFEKLSSLFAELLTIPSTDDIVATIKEELVKAEPFISKKFKKFITDNIPNNFFDIPDELQKDGPLSELPKDSFERYLTKIYDSRCKYLHEGKPFPSYVDIGVRRFVAVDSIAPLFQVQLKDIFLPPFIWFERVVHSVIIEYLKKKCAPELVEREKDRAEEKR